MKHISYYQDAGTYPKRPIKPILKTAPTASEARKYAALMDVYENEIAEYDIAVTAYQMRKNELEAEFRRDLIEDNGLTGHPKAFLLFEKAWDRGHSTGYGEVAHWFNDLAELIV